MNREIKFRGKRVDGKGWVYGVPLYGNLDDNFTEIQTKTSLGGEIVEVDPSSIGLWTGVEDKNGNMIWEGDIVRCWDDSANDYAWGLDKIHTGVVEYAPPCFSLAVSSELTSSDSVQKHDIDGEYPNTKCYLDRWINAENIEVVGNIHDNPEILQGGGQ